MLDIESLQAICDEWWASPDGKEKEAKQMAMFANAETVRNLIRGVELPADIKEEITKAYQTFEGENPAVACRSSATTEDTEEASFAGQHDTFLNQRGIDEVLHSVRECWASMFTDRAVEYRTRNKVKHEDAVMCVVVQIMVSADCAGTGFSVELGTSYPAIHVAALYGLGEGLVSGEITSDEWLVENGSHNIIKRVCGSKRTMYRSLPNGGGVELVDVPEEQQKVLCLEDDVVRSIAYAIENIKSLYQYLFNYNDIDTELAIAGGAVLFLQCRPIVELDM